MRLHIGCGKRKLSGYTNIDADSAQHPDIVAMAHAIPLDDGCAEEILAVHLFEHFYRWECDEVLAEWARLLKSGGRLVMELPDLVKCCQNVISNPASRKPDQLSMWGLYGDPTDKNPYMVHRWAWHFASLKPLLVEHGFVDAHEEVTQWHPTGRDNRDFRVVAIKP